MKIFIMLKFIRAYFNMGSYKNWSLTSARVFVKVHSNNFCLLNIKIKKSIYFVTQRKTPHIISCWVCLLYFRFPTLFLKIRTKVHIFINKTTFQFTLISGDYVCKTSKLPAYNKTIKGCFHETGVLFLHHHAMDWLITRRGKVGRSTNNNPPYWIYKPTPFK